MGCVTGTPTAVNRFRMAMRTWSLAVCLRSLGHELLAKQLYAVHLGFGPASAVIPAPAPPDASAEALDGAQIFVPACRPGAFFLLRCGIAPGRHDRIRAPVRDGVTTAPGVVGPVRSDRRDRLPFRDLAEQIRQHGRIGKWRLCRPAFSLTA